MTMALTLALALAGPARADWDPNNPTDPTASTNHKMHFPQMPDLAHTGVDVLATFWQDPGVSTGTGTILADDWQCSGSGPVTDIHIWGSWIGDVLPDDASGVPGPDNLTFKLSIHEDVPIGGSNPLGFSHPGAELWQTVVPPGDPRVTSRLYAENLPEQFYDPNTDTIIGSDTKAWQYNFLFDAADSFVQTAGTIYWLDVQVFLPNHPEFEIDGPRFGWKSTRNIWNDNGVYGGNTIFGDSDPPPVFWKPMSHPVVASQLDLAFVITPEPATMSLLVLGTIGVLTRRRRRRAE